MQVSIVTDVEDNAKKCRCGAIPVTVAAHGRIHMQRFKILAGVATLSGLALLGWSAFAQSPGVASPAAPAVPLPA